MSNRSVVNLDGKFVLSTRYGANPIILGLDLYRGKKDVPGIVRAARFWEIDNLDQRYRGVVEAHVPEARFTEEAGKDFFVRLVDFGKSQSVSHDYKRAALDRVAANLNQQEKTFVVLRYFELQGEHLTLVARTMGITEDEAEKLGAHVIGKVGRELEDIGVPIVQSGCIVYNVSRDDVSVRMGDISASLQETIIAEDLANPNQPELRIARRMELTKKYLDVLAEVEKAFPEDSKVRVLAEEMNGFQEIDLARLQTLRSIDTDMEQTLRLLEENRSRSEKRADRLDDVLVTQKIEDASRDVFEILKKCAERDTQVFSDLIASGDPVLISRKLKEMTAQGVYHNERSELIFMDVVRSLGLDEGFGNFLIDLGSELRYVDAELLRRQFLK